MATALSYAIGRKVFPADRRMVIVLIQEYRIQGCRIERALFLRDNFSVRRP